MRFLSLTAITIVALVFPSIIAADPSQSSSKCIIGASSSLVRSSSQPSNLYEARFITNQAYHQQQTKYPDYVDLHWSISEPESKDNEKSLQSFVVRIAQDGQMEQAGAIAVNQDGLYLTAGQRIRYWHTYSIDGELCTTEAESYIAKEESPLLPSAVSSASSSTHNRVNHAVMPVNHDMNHMENNNNNANNVNNNNNNNKAEIKETTEELEVEESSDDFQSQQMTPPAAPNNPSAPVSPTSPVSPASPASPASPTAPTTPTTPPVARPQQQFPEPPATCANDEYFCQLYKGCYSCVASPNQPLCEQCNKVFTCTDVNCRQKETCNLCKNFWKAYQNTNNPAGPFVCSVVRGQC